ncbi:SHSP domain-containing protein [Aphelenchoides fujianensis]|nr:SHSP domain-containing protein [Aphelenchoides fujianensis]
MSDSHIRRQTQAEMNYRYRGSPFTSSYFPSSRWLDDLNFGPAVPVSGPTFSIQLDVSSFRPEDLKVTVIENQVVIEGRHDERNDRYGQVELHDPDSIKPEEVTSELSKDGVLTVQTLRKPPVEEEKVRQIPIQPKN